MPREKIPTFPRPWIAAARKKTLVDGKPMTQTQLGERIGMTKKAVSAYECGRRHPGYGTATSILDALPILKQQGYTMESFYPKRDRDR